MHVKLCLSSDALQLKQVNKVQPTRRTVTPVISTHGVPITGVSVITDTEPVITVGSCHVFASRNEISDTEMG